MKWQDNNDTFSCTFEEDLEDHRVYVNIHKSSLYKIAYKYHVLPCVDLIYWIISHTDLETMTLSHVSEMEIATFRA